MRIVQQAYKYFNIGDGFDFKKNEKDFIAQCRPAVLFYRRFVNDQG
jgi:hypothetical protein